MKKQIKYALKYSKSAWAGNKKIHVFLLNILAMVFAAGIMVSCKNSTATSQQGVATTDSMHASMDSLRSQFNASHAQIDELTTKSAALDSLIKAKDAEIARLDSKIKHLEKTNRSLASKLKADKKLIASLRDELSGKAKSYADQIGMLQNDKNDLMRQRDSLFAKYTHIKELGSVLHASDIHLMALHLKHNGKKEKNTKRARKADLLRVSFDIDENRIAEDGTKKLYLVIKDPEGNLLSNSSNGSGTTTSSTGAPLSYSVVKEIPLKQNEPVHGVTVNWTQDNDYKKGEYSIAIYNGGYKIGSGIVMLN